MQGRTEEREGWAKEGYKKGRGEGSMEGGREAKEERKGREGGGKEDYDYIT